LLCRHRSRSREPPTLARSRVDGRGEVAARRRRGDRRVFRGEAYATEARAVAKGPPVLILFLSRLDGPSPPALLLCAARLESAGPCNKYTHNPFLCSIKKSILSPLTFA
jgi:hypothetical protein